MLGTFDTILKIKNESGLTGPSLNFVDPKFNLEPIYFESSIFLYPNFIWPKKFYTNFLDSNHFEANKFLDPYLFTHTFSWTQKFILRDLILAQKFTCPNNSFGPKNIWSQKAL